MSQVTNPVPIDKKQLELQKKTEEEFIKRLEVLSFKIRKNPSLYILEIAKYKQDFLDIFQQVKDSPLQKSKKLCCLAIFLAQVSSNFKKVEYIEEFLNHYKEQMNPFTSCQSKDLRKLIQAHVINDVKRMNKHNKNLTLNRQIQNLISEILKKHSDKIAKLSLKIMIQLYKRNIWNDQKTVNIIASGCFNDLYKIKLISAFFLLETTEAKEELTDSDDEEEPEALKDKNVLKKTKAKIRKMDQEKKKVAKRLRDKQKKQSEDKNFFPIDQLYNQQDFAEKLFSILKKNNDKFQVKLVLMAILARLIGRHKLQILPFYTFLQKYLQPHQLQIQKILAYLAESVHESIPPQELSGIINHLIDNFINDRCTEQSMTMGINTVREMCTRNKFLLDDFQLGYIVNYFKYKNKNVSRAAKSMINLFRVINPKLLEKKFRGKISAEQLEGREEIFGDQRVATGIDGAELLQKPEDLIPIYQDRLLTDEDFKKIRFLRQKQLEIEQEQKYENQKFQEESEFEDDDQENEEEEGDDNGEKEAAEEVKQDDSQSNLSIDSEDEIDSSEDLENMEQKYLNLDDIQGNQQSKTSKKLKSENKKRKLDLDGFSSFEDDDEDDSNPHNFVNAETIGSFKKTKQERKLDFMELQQNKGKKNWGPKPKGGGTNNDLKLKQKPLSMIRPKKNRQVQNLLNTKNRIKNIKDQLGHVKSSKQAARKRGKQIKHRANQLAKN